MTTGYILLDTPNRAQPQGTYPRRGGARLSGTCIVHTSEGNWRSGVDSLTNLVRNRADWGCYHRACDWEDIALYYPWEWETWQDTETNNWAVGIAAACRTTDWTAMPADIREGYYRNLGIMAADFVTYMRDQYGVTVPLRRLTGAEARARVPGFAAHGDSGISRSDPGRDFDWAKFFAYTAQALTGSLSYASESITPEDFMATMTDQEKKFLLDALASLVDNSATKSDLKGVWKLPIDHRNPETGELEPGATTPETVLSYANWRLVKTLEAVTASARGIVDAVKAAPGEDAAKVAEDAYKAFADKLAGIKLTVTAGGE